MLTQLFENLLNRNLAVSPAARVLCDQLRGQRLAVYAESMGFDIALESVGDSLKLTRPAPAESAAQLRGTPVNLLALAGPSAADVIRRGAVRIDGDAEIAQQYQKLLNLLRPDLEEELSRLVGDAPAHRLSGFAHAALAYGRRVASTAAQNSVEYLAHESGDLIPRAEGEAMFRDIEKLRDDAARFASRLTQLEPPP
jgi:ubiquinone biosynthesis accessory factor UbiJ